LKRIRVRKIGISQGHANYWKGLVNGTGVLRVDRISAILPLPVNKPQRVHYVSTVCAPETV